MTVKLNVIKPSVNNMAARVFVRAADLDFSETDVFGQTRSPDFLAGNPAHLTPALEEDDLPRGMLWESCAIMQYLANKHALEDLYPKRPEHRAMIDSAMFYLIGTLYPLVARATYPALGFPLYPGEVGASDADEPARQAAAGAARDAMAEPLAVFEKFYLGDNDFINGDKPTIADIRLAATLEFLAVIDYPLPAWAKDYLKRMEDVLGSAYAEPAADVRGYIAHVRSQ